MLASAATLFCLVLYLSAVCGDPSFPRIVPEVLLKGSNVSCGTTSRTFIRRATKWLIYAYSPTAVRYNRTMLDSISLSELNHGEIVQCALEDDTDGRPTGWSAPVKYYEIPNEIGTIIPVIAGLGPARVTAPPDSDAVLFNCNFQIMEEHKSHLVSILLQNSSSCEKGGIVYNINKLYLNEAPYNTTDANQRNTEELFSQDLTVKLNRSRFSEQNKLHIKCGIRIVNFLIPTCTEIFFEEMPASTTSPPSTSQPCAKGSTSNAFHLHFTEETCEDYEKGEVLRLFLKKDFCLKDGNFHLHIDCKNQTTALLEVESSTTVSTQMLSNVLDGVALVTVADVPSQVSSTAPSSTPSMTSCVLAHTFIALSAVVGALLLLSVLVNIGLCYDKYKHKAEKVTHEELPTPSPDSTHASSSTRSVSRQVSEENRNAHNAVIITNTEQFVPSQTVACVEPHEVSHEDAVEYSAQVTPPSSSHNTVIRRSVPNSSSTRVFGHFPSAEHTAIQMPHQQLFSHRSGTPNVSASIFGETLSLPGTADDSIGMAGDHVVELHQEESVDRHREAASCMNPMQNPPSVPEGPRILGTVIYNYPNQLPRNSFIPHPQQLQSAPTYFIVPNTRNCSQHTAAACYQMSVVCPCTVQSQQQHTGMDGKDTEMV